MKALQSMLACAILFALSVTARAQAVEARLEAAPSACEVGEPVILTLSVVHPVGVTVKLADKALPLDASWELLDAKGQLTLTAADDPSRATTSWSWKVCSLEPGERDLPRTAVDFELGGAAKRLEATPGKLAVKGVLHEGEDAQRPVKGFRPIEIEEASAAQKWPLILGGIAALALVAYIGWRIGRGRRARGEPAPSAAVRLAALETRPLDSPQDVQAAHYVITSLLREAVDRRAPARRSDPARAPERRSGLTDQEWLVAASADLTALGLSADDVRALEALLERCAEVKYGTTRPTHWAARETIAKAREIALRVEPREVAA